MQKIKPIRFFEGDDDVSSIIIMSGDTTKDIGFDYL